MIPPELQRLLDHHALREIVARAALALDTRRFDDWLDLCTDDVVLVVPFDPAAPTVCEGRGALRELFGMLHRYEATTHFTGNTVADIDGDRATAVTYCIAHHLASDAAGRTNLRMAVRYNDSFVRSGDGWRMSRRDMEICWSELASSPPP